MTINPRYPSLGHYMGDSTPSAAEIELQRTVAASALIETLRKIVSDHDLPDDVAMVARLVIVKSERAFGFESIAERSLESSSEVEQRPVKSRVAGSNPASPANDSDYDADLDLVSQQMNRS